MSQEKVLRHKQAAKKQQQQQLASSKDCDTAASSHASAPADASTPSPQADKDRTTEAAATNGLDDSQQGKADQGGGNGGSEGSPFACVSAILGWETFHMVHVLWIGLVDLPGKAPEKDWEMQV